MTDESFFNEGEIVKLKRDSRYNDPKVGDLGIVWAVYAYYADERETLTGFDYEGAFWNKEGDCCDEMFEENEVEKVLKIEDAPYFEEMREFWLFINKKYEETEDCLPTSADDLPIG